MPGGEIYTAPIDDSAEGTIAFEFPAVYAGQFVEGIELRFSGSEVDELMRKKRIPALSAQGHG